MFQEQFLNRLRGSLEDLFHLKEEALFSFALDSYPIQDSFRYRARRLGLKMSSLLIDEKGGLDEKNLFGLQKIFEKNLFILGPQREGDALIYAHLKRGLDFLAQKEIWMAIQRFSLPLCHKGADKAVRETLWPESIRRLETAHVRRAVMAAWLTPLRQSTGSCFATAPAILIQKEAPLQFFKDLYDLLSMGQMKRVVAGREYVSAMSLSSGDGDLKKTALFLDRSYGFCLSMESVGVEMSAQIREKIKELGPCSPEYLLRALLLQHMGLTEEDLQEEESFSHLQIGSFLAQKEGIYYQKPTERTKKIETWKQKFHEACLSFKTITECTLLKIWEYSIASFSDVKTEFARWNLYIGLGMHPDEKDGVGSFLYKKVNDELQKCNAEIEKLTKESNEQIGAIEALDVMIQNAISEARQYQLQVERVSHLSNFNSMIEMRNHLIEKAEALAQFFVFLMTQYDQKFQESFQELFDPSTQRENAHLYDDSTAGFRLVYKHGRRDASQWTLISNSEQYIHSLRDFFSNVENEIQLPMQIEKEFLSDITTQLIQFIQKEEFLTAALQRAKERGRNSAWDYVSGGTLQTLLQSYCARDVSFQEENVTPRSAQELYHFLKQYKTQKSLLMHSPTHAFIFYPNLLSDVSTRKKDQKWDEIIQEHLGNQMSEKLDVEERALFLHLLKQKGTALSNEQFRLYLIDSLGPRFQNKEALVDSMLYEKTPVYDSFFAKEAVNRILKEFGQKEMKELQGNFFGPYDIYQNIKVAILNACKSALSEIDWDARIVKELQKEDLCPHFSLFADTNWSSWFFGFVSHPVSGEMELWRLNRCGMQGFPMSDWKEWLNRENSSTWTILSNPDEYSF